MNTEPLQPLEGRWPNDQVLVKNQPGLHDVADMLHTPAEQSIYQDNLVIDEQDREFISSFAAKNAMSYNASVYITTAQYGGKPPAWLGAQVSATRPVFAHETTGTLYGYKVSMCVAYSVAATQKTKNYPIGDPRAEPVRLVRKSIIRVTLPKVFPQLVLDSNKNDKSSESTIPSSFKDNQKMTLEGNFANYFDFYSPVGLQVNSLTVLAPNFMQILIDSASTFDVEFYGNELVLITRDPIYTPSVMATALRALEAQLQYMDRLLPSWNYQPIDQPFDLLQKTYLDGAVMKVGALRIKPALLLTVLLLFFVLFGVLISVFNHRSGLSNDQIMQKFNCNRSTADYRPTDVYCVNPALYKQHLRDGIVITNRPD